jgi:hypothetical protein
LQKDHHYLFHLFGLGNLVPKTLSIFAIRSPEGRDFPASHALISDFWTHIKWANCYCVKFLAFLAWAIAILKSWGIDAAKWLNENCTFIIVLFVHDFGHVMGIKAWLVSVFCFLDSDNILSRFFCPANSLLSLGSVLEWACENGVTLFLHSFFTLLLFIIIQTISNLLLITWYYILVLSIPSTPVQKFKSDSF